MNNSKDTGFRHIIGAHYWIMPKRFWSTIQMFPYRYSAPCRSWICYIGNLIIVITYLINIKCNEKTQKLCSLRDLLRWYARNKPHCAPASTHHKTFAFHSIWRNMVYHNFAKTTSLIYHPVASNRFLTSAGLEPASPRLGDP